jgi:hypothetical protein
VDGATGVARSRARVASDLVKRLLIAIAGAVGLRALLRRRHAHEPAAEPPVDELRQKLAEARATESAPEPPPEPEPQGGVEERRADVHEQARRAIDELREP